eukprot:3520678-Pyramimonas_sp.AAC.2
MPLVAGALSSRLRPYDGGAATKGALTVPLYYCITVVLLYLRAVCRAMASTAGCAAATMRKVGSAASAMP